MAMRYSRVAYSLLQLLCGFRLLSPYSLFLCGHFTFLLVEVWIEAQCRHEPIESVLTRRESLACGFLASQLPRVWVLALELVCVCVYVGGCLSAFHLLHFDYEDKPIGLVCLIDSCRFKCFETIIFEDLEL